MRRRDRHTAYVPPALAALAVTAVGLWIGTGSAIALGAAIGCSLASAVLAIEQARRLAGKLRRCQEAIQKSERMRLLGLVSGGLAHQLRNATAGAKLAVQLHARTCEAGEDESLDSARRQLARVEADLGRFLDLGRDDVPRRPCRVADLVEEAVALLRPRCRNADVQLCWEPPIIDPVIDADPGRIGHVLINLLTNAVEAAGEGGHVELSVTESDDDRCVIEVWDSGPGLEPAVERRLFQPFVTGKADGVGLGLYVARQASEAHGGRLDWRRDHGRTCFRVELPTAGDAAPESAAATANASPRITAAR
jgi:signal transduction histidine kinase